MHGYIFNLFLSHPRPLAECRVSWGFKKCNLCCWIYVLFVQQERDFDQRMVFIKHAGGGRGGVALLKML
jgi:hypothetical protein